MGKLINLDTIGIEELSSDEEKLINGGGVAHFVGWVVGGVICSAKCAGNWLGIHEPGKW